MLKQPVVKVNNLSEQCIFEHSLYAHCLSTGFRSNVQSVDLSDTLPEEVEEEVKAAAEISMGTEVNICLRSCARYSQTSTFSAHTRVFNTPSFDCRFFPGLRVIFPFNKPPSYTSLLIFAPLFF